MTEGKEGVKAFCNEKVTKVEAFKVDKVIDTTGAGDMFAAGFLFKILKEESLHEALIFGCKVASKIICQYGARLDSELFKKI